MNIKNPKEQRRIGVPGRIESSVCAKLNKIYSPTHKMLQL
jgi:hypothetical protein